MAAQLLAHPLYSAFFGTGDAEKALFVRDPDTRIMLRARLDWVTTFYRANALPRACIVDYKTTGKTADPDEFRWEVGRFGYHMQDVWYREVLDLLNFADAPPSAFVFCVQEKEPPYLVSFVELDDVTRDVGVQNNRVARRRFLQCMTTDSWPGYPAVVHQVTVPNVAYLPERTA
jgi:hypothetical protein